MKKLFIFAVMALVFIACTPNDVKYSLSVSGNVITDTVSNTLITFDNVGVCNDSVLNTYFYANDVESLCVTEGAEYENASNWTDQFVADNMITPYLKQNNNATYLIHVKGYIREPRSGLVAYIDKDFTNR